MKTLKTEKAQCLDDIKRFQASLGSTLKVSLGFQRRTPSKQHQGERGCGHSDSEDSQ